MTTRHEHVPKKREKLTVDQWQIILPAFLKRGKKNARTVKEIHALAGAHCVETGQQLRQAAKQLLDEGIPIISNTKGFYIAASNEELVEYELSLMNRIEGLKKTLQSVRKCHIK